MGHCTNDETLLTVKTNQQRNILLLFSHTTEYSRSDTSEAAKNGNHCLKRLYKLFWLQGLNHYHQTS